MRRRRKSLIGYLRADVCFVGHCDSCYLYCHELGLAIELTAHLLKHDRMVLPVLCLYAMEPLSGSYTDCKGALFGGSIRGIGNVKFSDTSICEKIKYVATFFGPLLMLVFGLTGMIAGSYSAITGTGGGGH